MPQIQEYRSRIDLKGPAGPQRAASSEDFGGATGRALEQTGNRITEASDRIQRAQGQREISDLNAKMSGLHAQSAIELQQALQQADPNDKELSQKFIAKFDDAVSKLGDNIETSAGRQYFNQASAAMRAHFQEQAAHGQADLIGVKAKQDYTQALNNYSSSLVNDPSSYGLMKGMHDAGIDALVQGGGLPAQAGIKLKEQGNEELAKSAIRGWIRIAPDVAQKQLDSGQWNSTINGDTKIQMYGEVKQAQNAARIEEERRRQEQERLKKAAQVDTQNKMLEALSTNSLKTEDVLSSNLEPFGSGSKEQFLKLIERSQTADNKPIKTNSDLFITLFDKIHLPDGDPNKLNDENELNQYVGRGLSMESLHQLRAEMQGKKTEAGSIESQMKKGVLDIAKSTLTKSNALTGIKDPQGDEQYQRYSSFFLDEYAKQRKAGKSATELLDPDSKDYLGKYVKNFTRSQQQILKDMTKSIGGEVERPSVNALAAPIDPKKVRQPGESAGDYLKRMEKEK